MSRQAIVWAMLSAAMATIPTPLTAQELTNCFVEATPCGNPAQLERLIRECLRDPSLCGHRSEQRLPGSASVVPEEHRPVPGKYAIRSVAANSPASTTAVSTAIPERQFTEVDAAASNLPLEHSVRVLVDALPTDAGAIELRLGLRRPHVAGIDMRGRTPSSVEIVQALAPPERAP